MLSLLAAMLIALPALAQVGSVPWQPDLDPSDANAMDVAWLAHVPEGGFRDLPHRGAVLERYELPEGDTYLHDLPREVVVDRDLPEGVWKLIDAHPDGSRIMIRDGVRWATPRVVLRGVEVAWWPGADEPLVHKTKNDPVDVVLEGVAVTGRITDISDGQVQTIESMVVRASRYWLDRVTWSATSNGPHGAELVQRSRFERIVADPFQNVDAVLGVRVHNVGGFDDDAHTDVYQAYGGQSFTIDGLFVTDTEGSTIYTSAADRGRMRAVVIRDVVSTADHDTGRHSAWLIGTDRLTMERVALTNQRLRFGLPNNTAELVHTDARLIGVTSKTEDPRGVEVADGVSGLVFGTTEELAPPRPNEDAIPPAIDPASVVHDLNIGWSGKDPATRHIGRSIPKRGWAWFVEDKIVPALDLGVRRVMLRNPFGVDANEPMDFDQVIEVRRVGNPLLEVESFVRALTPVARGDYTGGEPVEVIVYIGDPDGDPDMTALRHDPAAWMNRAEDATGELIAAGFSFGLDSTTGVAEGSIEHVWMTLLEVPWYVEAWPRRDTAWLHGRPVVILDNGYVKNVEPWFDNPPDSQGQHAPIEAVGEVVRIVRPRAGEDWPTLLEADAIRARLAEIIADRQTPAVDVTKVAAEVWAEEVGD